MTAVLAPTKPRARTLIGPAGGIPRRARILADAARKVAKVPEEPKLTIAIAPSRIYDDLEKICALLLDGKVRVLRMVCRSSDRKNRAPDPNDKGIDVSTEIAMDLAHALANGLRDAVMDVLRTLERLERDQLFVVRRTRTGTKSEAGFVEARICNGRLLAVARGAVR